MPKKTLILIVALACITGGLIYMALTTQSTPPPSTTTPITTTQVNNVQPVKKTATLLFNPSSVTLSSTGSASSQVTVLVKTEGQKVSGAQLEILFDPNVISNLSVSAGNDSIFGSSGYFELPQSVDYKTGRASYAVGVNLSNTPENTEGKVATISFTAHKPPTQNSSVIQLLNKSIVTQIGVNESILKNTQSLTLHFE